MANDRTPMTSAIRALRAAGVDYEPHQFRYEPRGGTAHSAATLGVDEHRVVKTLLFEDQDKSPLVVLMHGDLEVAPGLLARAAGVKKTAPCAPNVAERHSGYQVGGTSPFGLARPLPIFAERTIADLDHLYINGGKRGFLVRITPDVLETLLAPTWAEIAAPKR